MKAADTERILIRTIAGASRPLDEDMKLTRLGAIDKLQQLHQKFREQWIGPSPWLVLADGYTMPDAPVELMLQAMDAHGDAVGIVGMAWLKRSNRLGIFKAMFRSKADRKAAEHVQRSADAASQQLVQWMKEFDLKRGKTE